MARTRTLVNTGGTTWDVSKLGIATPIPATTGTLDISAIFTDAEIAGFLQRGDLALSATNALRIDIPAGGTVDLVVSTDFGMVSDYLMQHNLASVSGGANKVIVTDSNGDVNIGARFFLSSGAPTTGSQVVNKTYVDSVAQGLHPLTAVNLATAGALPACTAAGTGVGKTLTGNAFGALTIDGVAASGRVLVKDQVAAKDDGIYDVTNAGGAAAYFVLTRVADFNSNTNVKCGSFLYVQQGVSNNNYRFVLTTPNPINIDVDALSFSVLSGPDELEAGNGIGISDGVVATSLGNGLEYGSGGDAGKNQIKRDVTTGATVAPVATSANGAGVSVDNSTITHSSGTLSVSKVPTKGQKMLFAFSRTGSIPNNSFLRSQDIFSNVSSYRMLRACKVTGMAVQLGTAGTTVDFKAYKNGSLLDATVDIAVGSAAGAIQTDGSYANNTLAAGDVLSVYATNITGTPKDVVMYVEVELTA